MAGVAQSPSLCGAAAGGYCTIPGPVADREAALLPLPFLPSACVILYLQDIRGGEVRGGAASPHTPIPPGWGRALSQTAGVCRCGRSGRCGEAQPPRAPPAGTQRLTASWTWFQQGYALCCPRVPDSPLPDSPPLGEGTGLLPPAGGGWEGGRRLRTVHLLRTMSRTIKAMSLANARIAPRARIESFLDRTGANGPVRPWRNMEP